MKPGEGRIIACLKEHEAELSAPCKAAGEEKRAAKKEMKEACKADTDALCKDIKPGDGRLIKCLKENEAKLSEKCKAEMAERKEKAMENHPCAADRALTSISDAVSFRE